MDPDDARRWLDSCSVDPAVLQLRPDYRALLVVVLEVGGGTSDQVSDAALAEAERAVRDGEVSLEHLHVQAWREAFRAFGAKPQRTRPSVEALVRRAGDGLPRVDRLTDLYNAVSVRHVVPLGGEDLDAYAGPLRLVRAGGEEPFATTASGEDVVEHPEPGEVVWRDDDGVTCRRWNWRQCTRTRLNPRTQDAVFVLDALAPLDDGALDAAGDAVVGALGVPADRVLRRRLPS